MSPIFGDSSSGRARPGPGSPPQQHRRHRHKRFHVRREAYGEGYETFAPLPQSGSPCPVGDPASTPNPAAEMNLQNVSAPTAASVLSEWSEVSAKKTNRRAARSALRFSLKLIPCLIAVALFCRYSDWPLRFAAWLRQFPFPGQ
jgi:hypothetical protein